ncbi:cell wall elongation regulator TseB-like domain-containing protein [Sutcliffiella cohnii]
MKKWIISILVIGIGIVLWQSISTYQSATSSLKQDERRATQLAYELSDITKVEQIDIYRGTTFYMIVQGLTASDEKIVIWIDEEEKIVETKNSSDGIPREEVLNYLQTDRNPQKIHSISLAMENNLPLWEIKFTDAANRYNLYYITFEKGEFFQRITF